MIQQPVAPARNRSELGEFVSLFLCELPLRISVIEQQFSGGDRESLCRSAHQLKSAAGSYDFADLCLYAGRVEALCRDRQTSQELLEQAVDELLDQASRVRS